MQRDQIPVPVNTPAREVSPFTFTPSKFNFKPTMSLSSPVAKLAQPASSAEAAVNILHSPLAKQSTPKRKNSSSPGAMDLAPPAKSLTCIKL